MTTLNAQDSLAALVGASKMFTGFSLAGKLAGEIKISLALKGADGAEGNRRAAAAELRLREILAGFFAGSPRFFRGELSALRAEGIDGDLIGQVEVVLAKFTAAASRLVVDFAIAAKQYAAMSAMFGWARAEHRARRERAAATEAAKAARVAAAVEAVRRWTFEPPKPVTVPKPVREIRKTVFGGQLAAALAA
jgi:hypothetical protein